MVALNTGYLSTNRGIIKILQIICGFTVSSLLCTNWYNGKSCFSEGRLAFVSGLNFAIVIINVVLFHLNIFNLAVWKMERFYSMISTILFFVATVLIVWYIVEGQTSRDLLIASSVFIGIQFVLFLWDVKILQGNSPN